MKKSFIPRLILVSKSPRRREILRKAGFLFRSEDPGISEELIQTKRPASLARNLSMQKILAVKNKYPLSVLLAADTLVVCSGKVLGKPVNRSDAVRMLNLLSGKRHKVITGVTMYFPDSPDQKISRIVSGKLKKRTKDAFLTFHETSEVCFSPIPREAIRFYVKNNFPSDKAGAYAIQEWIGLRYIRKINGDYYNVMGLPVQRILDILSPLGFSSFTDNQKFH